jgi:hypothetical protein
MFLTEELLHTHQTRTPRGLSVIAVTKSMPGFSLERAVSAWEVAGHHSVSCWQLVVLVSGRTEVWVGCSEMRWGF